MRQAEELGFKTHDGVELFYRRWPAVAAKPRGAVLLFHRGDARSDQALHVARAQRMAREEPDHPRGLVVLHELLQVLLRLWKDHRPAQWAPPLPIVNLRRAGIR